MRDVRQVRHYRRLRARRHAMLLRELRRTWIGRLVLWAHGRRVQRELRGELPRRLGHA